MKISFNASILFNIFLAFLFAFSIYQAKDFPYAGRLFPLMIAGPALLLTLIQIIVEIRRQQKPDQDTTQDFVDIAPDRDIPPDAVSKRGFRFLAWIIGVYLGIWFVGFKVTVPLFFIAFMRIEGKASWRLIFSLTAISVYMIFYHFEELLGVFWPRPLIANWVKIPWIF